MGAVEGVFYIILEVMGRGVIIYHNLIPTRHDGRCPFI
jgi:hypothetical protein